MIYYYWFQCLISQCILDIRNQFFHLSIPIPIPILIHILILFQIFQYFHCIKYYYLIHPLFVWLLNFIIENSIMIKNQVKPTFRWTLFSSDQSRTATATNCDAISLNYVTKSVPDLSTKFLTTNSVVMESQASGGSALQGRSFSKLSCLSEKVQKVGPYC